MKEEIIGKVKLNYSWYSGKIFTVTGTRSRTGSSISYGMRRAMSLPSTSIQAGRSSTI